MSIKNLLMVVVLFVSLFAFAVTPVEAGNLVYQCKAAQISRTVMQIAGPQVVVNGQYVCQTRAASKLEIARWDAAAKLRAAKAAAEKAAGEFSQGIQDLGKGVEKKVAVCKQGQICK